MNEPENKKEYEMSYLLTPEITEDKTGSEVEELKKILVENGGDIVQMNPLEKKRLAYPVKKQNQAYFGVVYFNADKDGLDKIKKTLAFYKKILRLLILTHSTSSTIIQGGEQSRTTSSELIKSKPSPIITQQPAKTPASTQSFDQKLESILKG
ncbi:MAG: 30S ribosomal protein S6 [Candidatus Azambacteria bacterium]|nr:30S ribosomal protein S6 [Candidatus Azambacteria bacterium]